MIEVTDLKKIYRMGSVEVAALKGVSATIARGEFVGIMGPSGSGKSTFLHQLGLLDTPTSGRIVLDGTDVSRLTDEERTHFRLMHLGYVFQDYALVSELTVKENVAIPAIMKGRPLSACYAAATEVLEKVGLSRRLDHLVHELSGGEQQRVSIARALVNRPAILFADEPCANLDTENSRTVLELFRAVNKDLGQTVVMVSHEPWHREYFDRIIFIRDGLPDTERTERGGQERGST
ncbi:ABC transporter ATP-binding protein [Methanoregula formicica]|uniref:ABC-type antimicrobial peptide transport system, ATPase component n=1 Tax=Methanoregula formicica (strain DSM 22288 / NBRC 105244 / SMSP) TaxID=593750 RepID=L0HEL4_METFS|nr:ABC transporter ATP-binding protein [Methanoregula formicica]AGB01549.1 ABC-type antimicrobial peptide transport system, ATPase component [Methanoregula formicica SMSP]